MVGGDGADVFSFKPGYGSDEVGDFESGYDSIELQGFSLDDYTTTYTGYSTTLSFNTGDELILYWEDPLVELYATDSVYVA